MKLMKALTSVAALTVGATGAFAQERVAISVLNWTGAKAIAHVIQAVINGPLNSEAEIVEGLSDQAIIGAGMDLQLDGEDWLEVSSAGCATPDASIYVSHSKSLEQRNPAAAKFLSQIQLDPATVNQWILEIGRDEKDPQDVAEAWVADNMDIVESWIN